MPRRQLARRLRRLREDAGLTVEEAARKLETSSSKLSRIENAQQGVDVHWVKGMLDLYGLTLDRWEPYLGLCRQAAMRGWWRNFGLDDRGYVGLEAAATLVRESAMIVVPGLLQTAEYARALFDSATQPWPEEQRQREVQVRMRRQRRLYTEDDSVALVAVLDEAVLHRRTGGTEVWRGQLEHLLIAAELDTVTIQVVPFDCAARPGLDGSFILLSFADPDEPDLAYVEYVTGAMHIEKAEAVRRSTVTFDRLRSVALGRAESIALMERLIAEP